MAFNPFATFTKPLLDAFIIKGKKFFVRQSFPRGVPLVDDTVKEAFLITHYSTIAEAHAHFILLVNDKHRFLYEADNEEHLKKLNTAAIGVPGYRIYGAVAMPNWQERTDLTLKKKVKNYIDNKIKWKPSRHDSVDFDIFVHLGEVYAKLKLRNQVIEVRLDEIENFK